MSAFFVISVLLKTNIFFFILVSLNMILDFTALIIKFTLCHFFTFNLHLIVLRALHLELLV